MPKRKRLPLPPVARRKRSPTRSKNPVGTKVLRYHHATEKKGDGPSGSLRRIEKLLPGEDPKQKHGADPNEGSQDHVEDIERDRQNDSSKTPEA